jgi:hypothetical protein
MILRISFWCVELWTIARSMKLVYGGNGGSILRLRHYDYLIGIVDLEPNIGIFKMLRRQEVRSLLA